MRIIGLDKLAEGELHRQLTAGARFVFYEYCISFVFVTLRRPSAVYYLRPGKWGIVRGWQYTLVSLLLGWWGVPWGFIYTPLCIVTNLSGGCDVTNQVCAQLNVDGLNA